MNPLILIVDDEKPIRHFIKVSLETQHYDCIESEDGSNALMLIASHHPDVVVLDLGLPDMDGLEVIKKARLISSIPIIVVSARGHEREKVVALDAGADDYLTKPFGVAELLARIRVSLRHSVSTENRTDESKPFVLDDLSIDFEKRKIKMGDKEIHITPTEYNLLVLLVKHRGKVLTHKFILKEIWGTYTKDDTQLLRVSMGNLRRKIEINPTSPRYIITEVGVGYRMVDE